MQRNFTAALANPDREDAMSSGPPSPVAVVEPPPLRRGVAMGLADAPCLGEDGRIEMPWAVPDHVKEQPLKVGIAAFPSETPAEEAEGATVAPLATATDGHAQHLLQVTVPDMPPALEAVDWVVTADRSGSMRDICKDGKTKAQQLDHTIRNVCGYLNDLAKNAEFCPASTVTVISFDQVAETVFERKKVTELDAEGLAKVLGEPGGYGPLAPRGSTNVGQALDKARETTDRICSLGQPQTNVGSRRVVHIFLTDGHITCGETQHSRLRAKVPYHMARGCVRNAFVGYGHEHCAHLLQNLARDDLREQMQRNTYHFVDSLEHAGMVFGEIVQNAAYEQAYSIRITVTDGSIYDPDTREWGTVLHTDPMASGDKRTWVVRSNGATQPRVSVQYDRTGTAFEITTEASEPETTIPVEDFAYAAMRQRCIEAMAEARGCMDREHGTCPLAGHRAPRLPSTPGGLFCAAADADESTALNQHDKVLSHALLDMAKVGQWAAVRAMLQTTDQEKQALLAHALPHPRRYRLIHHAAEQGQLEVVKELVEMGAQPVATRDGVTLTQLAAPHPATLAYVAAIELVDAAPNVDMSRTEVLALLDKLLADIKKITSNEDQYDEAERKRYQELSDDIYIARLSMTAANASLAAAYMGSRAASQGRQGGYCGGDVEALTREQTQEGTVFRSATREYAVRNSGTRTGASFGAAAAMQRCMGAAQNDPMDSGDEAAGTEAGAGGR